MEGKLVIRESVKIYAAKCKRLQIKIKISNV